MLITYPQIGDNSVDGLWISIGREAARTLRQRARAGGNDTATEPCDQCYNEAGQRLTVYTEVCCINQKRVSHLGISGVNGREDLRKIRGNGGRIAAAGIGNEKEDPRNIQGKGP